MIVALSAALWLSLATLFGDPPAPSATPPATPPGDAPATTGIEGRWQGTIESNGGALFVLIEAHHTGSAQEVFITAPSAGMLRGAGADVIVHDRTLSFTLQSRGINGRFRGDVSADGTAYVGALQLGKAGANTDEVPFSLPAVPDPKKAANAVRWEGKLEVPNGTLPMSFTIADLGEGKHAGVIDIPMQSLSGFPVVVERQPGDFDAKPRWSWTLPGLGAELDLSEIDADTMRGVFKQGGTLPIELKRVVGASTVELKRTQVPTPPFPYRVEDVVIKHRFGHTLAGTLTLPQRTPDSPAKFPAIVLVSGSGPQDRDETLLGHKPFLVLADALTRAGVAVLRYDDRGVGGSTGKYDGATTYDFAIDADEASEWLKKHAEIDAAHVGLVGHSEGGMVAPVVAAWQWDKKLGSPTPIAFIVLLAGPGLSGKEVLTTQMRRILSASGIAAEKIDPIVVAQKALLEASVSEGKPADEIVALARELVRLQVALGDQPIGDDVLEQNARATAASTTSAWMRGFIVFNPSSWIARLRIPILAMNGTLDTQVDADPNLFALELAAKQGGAPLTVKRYDGLNHLFQPAMKGTIDEYATIETTFDPAALQDLIDWILARSKEAPLPRPQEAAPMPAPIARPQPPAPKDH